MKVDDIISYHEITAEEKGSLQQGMNFRPDRKYSILLMSVSDGAHYDDVIDEQAGLLIYEGHNEDRKKGGADPRTLDQPLLTPAGTWTQNGKFFQAALNYRAGIREKPELVRVYEKIRKNIWCNKGYFELVNAAHLQAGQRKVFKLHLRPVEKKPWHGTREIAHHRIIPSAVKIDVWKRDQGKCAICGAEKNLHFDHIIPFSKGGSSITTENIRLLCLKHNLEKSNKIISILPWLCGTSAALMSTDSLG